MSAPPIVVVDDDEPLRRAVRRQLERRGHRVLEASGVAEARRLLDQLDEALVLCDIDMPGESGLVLVQELQARQPAMAVVMVTAVDEPEVAFVALERGAYGYVLKPFGGNELAISVVNALRRRELELEHLRSTRDLARMVDERTAELVATNDELLRAHEETIRRLAFAAEYRDPETANHLERMSRYSELLALGIGLDPAEAALLRLAAPMHDIGKIGIDDDVLRKPGRFDDHDREVMARHPEIGHHILDGSASPLLQLAATVALTHHERWDGTGYPAGLAGDRIPLAGRIVAIADVFDALCSRRRYKDPMPATDALASIRAGAGTHFDPDLVARFAESFEELQAIAGRWSDDDERVGMS